MFEINCMMQALACSDLLALLELSSLGSDVGLGVGTLGAWGSAEVLLGFSVLGSSKEESVCAYYNI